MSLLEQAKPMAALPGGRMRVFALTALVALAGCPDPTTTAPDADVNADIAVDNGTDTPTVDVPDTFDVSLEASDAGEDVPDAEDVGGETDVDGSDAQSGTYTVQQLTTGLPSEYVFKDLWASQAGTAVAVGNDGVVATYDGSKWAGKATGNAELLNAVHGVGPDDVWAVGKSGAVLRGSATTGDFTLFEAPGATLPTLWGVSALASNNVVGVGLSGTIARFDGSQWNQLSGPGQAGIHWRGMTGAAGLVVLVGDNGAIGVLGGAGLELPGSNVTSTLHDVATDGATTAATFVAVGDFGTVVKGDGLNWAPMIGIPTATSLRGVFVESPTSVFVVGDFGTALHYDGIGWSSLTTGTFVNLRTVTVSAIGTVTMAGGDGVVVTGTLAGGLSVTDTLSPGSDLTAAWGLAEKVTLVGDAASVFHGGPNFISQATPITQNLRDVWGFSDSDIWAVGLLGKVIHWDGATWAEFPSSTFEGLEAVWGTAPDDVFAAGAGGTLLHFDGSEWSKLASNTTNNLKDVFALSPSEIWAVGTKGTIMFFDGLGWNQQTVTPEIDAEGTEIPFVSELHGVWASGPDDAWAVGADGAVVHWDGVAWNDEKVSFGVTLRGIFGRAPDQIWAVGNEGHMIVYNGDSWQPVQTGSIATLYAIDGTPSGDNSQLFVTGDIGTILSVEWVPTP